MKLSTLTSIITYATAASINKESTGGKELKYIDGTPVRALLALYDEKYIGEPLDGIQPLSFAYVPENATSSDIENIVMGKSARLVEHNDDPEGKWKACCKIKACGFKVKLCVGTARVQEDSQPQS